jgi:uncharacterized RmlC-like cupin family protein
VLAANKATCRVIRAKDGVQEGKQGTFHQAGISAQTAGAERLCLHLLTMPPGGRARPHLHESHETALYVISGIGVTWYGEGLSERVVTRAGDYLYIPPNVPHVAANLSLTEPCVGVAARTDPNEQESVRLLPELNERADRLIDEALANPSLVAG